MTTLGQTNDNNNGMIISSGLPYELTNDNNNRNPLGYTSSSTQNTKNHKNQKTTKQLKNIYLNQLEVISIPPTPPKYISDQQTTLTSQNQTQTLTNTPIRRWRNIGGNALQQLLDAPTDSSLWRPTTKLPVEKNPTTDFSSLLHNPMLSSIHDYCQSPSTTTILRLKRKPDVHITPSDLRDIINHNTPIHHESLILSLEVMCTAYEATYVDPSFIPTLRTQGWQGVSNRFVPIAITKIDQPHLNHPNIAIPVHIQGNHWLALCRRLINGVVHFIYANDLNIPRTEMALKKLLQTGTSTEFYPPNSRWVSCRTPIFRPHSNECGPRTMLALAVMISHPAPHPTIIHTYISSNLAQHSRHWMCIVLLMGIVPFLEQNEVTQANHPPVIESIPATLISWQNTITTRQRNTSCTQSPHPEERRGRIDIISPKHKLINRIQAEQQEKTNNHTTRETP
jgi:hypothetical protein